MREDKKEAICRGEEEEKKKSFAPKKGKKKLEKGTYSLLNPTPSVLVPKRKNNIFFLLIPFFTYLIIIISNLMQNKCFIFNKS